MKREQIIKILEKTGVYSYCSTAKREELLEQLADRLTEQPEGEMTAEDYLKSIRSGSRVSIREPWHFETVKDVIEFLEEFKAASLQQPPKEQQEKERTVESQERAAIWISENISEMPLNIGELTAVLQLYADSLQQLPKEQLEKDVVIIEKDQYKEIIKDDIEAVLKYIPENLLVRDHILTVLKDSVEQYYPLQQPPKESGERIRRYPIMCPSCNGTGFVKNNDFGVTPLTTSSTSVICPACNGSKTIIVEESTPTPALPDEGETLRFALSQLESYHEIANDPGTADCMLRIEAILTKLNK